jgi:RNA polymerase sigma-70 factor, ECF subfamily
MLPTATFAVCVCVPNIRSGAIVGVKSRGHSDQRDLPQCQRGSLVARQDLLSEVFLDVWRQAGRFEYRSSVSTWLMSIARNKALSARRRRTDAELDEKIEATVADSADDPEVALQEKDRNELLRRALKRLSPEHRQVVDLVYYHEKSVDDVAHILNVLPATVKTRMFHARKKLAGLVKGG